MRFVDLHCDTLYKLTHGDVGANRLRRNGFHMDLERLHAAGCAAQFFAIFLDTNEEQSRAAGDTYERCLETAAFFHSEMSENGDIAAFAGCAADVDKNIADGKVSCFLTVEDSGIFGGEVERLHTLYNLGVRLVTLTWNHKNAVGSPNTTPEYSREGLAPQGFALLGEMERLGVIADVSHLGDAGFWDVVHNSTRPFVASHTNCRAIAPVTRNLDDDQLRAVADCGGVVGLNYCGAFVKPRDGDMFEPFGAGSGRCTVHDLAAHAAHMIRVAGEDVCALGSDFDGISDRPDGVDGVQNLPLIVDALCGAGLTERQVEKVLFGNAMRVVRSVM